MKKLISTLILSLATTASFAFSEVVQLTKKPQVIDQGMAVEVYTNKGTLAFINEEEILFYKFQEPTVTKGTCVKLDTESKKKIAYNKMDSNVRDAKVVACPIDLGSPTATAKPKSNLAT